MSPEAEEVIPPPRQVWYVKFADQLFGFLRDVKVLGM